MFGRTSVEQSKVITNKFLKFIVYACVCVE